MDDLRYTEGYVQAICKHDGILNRELDVGVHRPPKVIPHQILREVGIWYGMDECVNVTTHTPCWALWDVRPQPQTLAQSKLKVEDDEALPGMVERGSGLERS